MIAQVTGGQSGVIHLIGVFLGCFWCFWGLIESFCDILRLPDGQRLVHDLLCQRPPGFLVVQGEDGTGVASGELVFLHQCLQILRQAQQTESIGNGGTGFAHLSCHSLLGHAVFGN